ncbi:MAG: hypothetical protein HC916_05890 [Coleofasciculaceae cyanobacterium SM2_1_6]|nr:hypothetical protein [Coleofasciculaceae cyanobacterium SM2_1_6]
MINHSQWATIWKWENSQILSKIILQLGLSAIELVDRPPRKSPFSHRRYPRRQPRQ